MGILFPFLTALVTAVSNIVIKTGTDKTAGKNNGFLITIFVNVVVQGIILFIALVAKKFTFHFSWSALVFFILGGMLSAVFGRYALFSAINQINPSRASALKNSAPVFTILFALIILNEYLTLISSIGVFLILCALFMQGFMNFKETQRSQLEGKQGSKWTGYLLAVFAAFLFGIGQGVSKQGLLISDEPFFGAWIGSVSALIVVLIYYGIKGNFKMAVKENWSTLNWHFVVAGIMLSLGPLFFFLGASFIQVTYVSVIAAIEPLMTLILSAIFLKRQEKLNLSVWITAVLVLVGSILIALET